MKSIYAASVLFGVNISSAATLGDKSQTNAENKLGQSSLCDEIEILFLGTGAADWPVKKYPSDVNMLLRGDFRGFSSALINKKILIDCGPTVPLALEMFDVDVDLITDVVVTHTHGDHFSLETLNMLLKKRSNKEKINIWLEEGAVFKTEKLAGYNVHPLTVMKTFAVPGLEVLPLTANHQVGNSPEKPLHYLFSAKSKSFFYALDGGWLTTETWNKIRKKKIDAVIWDSTVGEGDGDFRIFSHNSLNMIRCMNQTLRSNRVLKDSSLIILTHMARTLHTHHSKLKEAVLPEKMKPAHDGMVVTI